jgi:Peptidase M50B-like
MRRFRSYLLIGSTLFASWLGMQAVHEAGHVLGAKLTGGRVEAVCLHPLTISHTELSENPVPLVVVWAGPVFGIIAPLLAWVIAAVVH